MKTKIQHDHHIICNNKNRCRNRMCMQSIWYSNSKHSIIYWTALKQQQTHSATENETHEFLLLTSMRIKYYSIPGSHGRSLSLFKLLVQIRLALFYIVFCCMKKKREGKIDWKKGANSSSNGNIRELNNIQTDILHPHAHNQADKLKTKWG